MRLISYICATGLALAAVCSSMPITRVAGDSNRPIDTKRSLDLFSREADALIEEARDPGVIIKRVIDDSESESETLPDTGLIIKRTDDVESDEVPAETGAIIKRIKENEDIVMNPGLII